MCLLFFHGINYEYLEEQYPYLNPRIARKKQDFSQRQDSEKLIKQFGFEPVHFISSNEDYSISECLKICFKFGNVVLIYNYLPRLKIYLSKNEVGVPVIDVRNVNKLVIYEKKLIPKLRKFIKNTPIHLIEKNVK